MENSKLVAEQLKSLATSRNRHGDLVVALSAAKRLNDCLQSLIGLEEQA